MSTGGAPNPSMKKKKKAARLRAPKAPLIRSVKSAVKGPKELGAMIQHLVARHKESGKSLSELKRDIPYFLPDFRKETQIVEARLYYLSVVATVAATAFNTVTSFSATGFNNFADFASIFDEYRITTGRVNYVPTTYVGTAAWSNDTGFCIACIDYGVSSANGTQLAAYSHDNKKMFNLVNVKGEKEIDGMTGTASWFIDPEPLPDQDWIPSTTSNTVFYYWKPYMEAANSPGTGTVGRLLGWHDFQFRGMAA